MRSAVTWLALCALAALLQEISSLLQEDELENGGLTSEPRHVSKRYSCHQSFDPYHVTLRNAFRSKRKPYYQHHPNYGGLVGSLYPGIYPGFRGGGNGPFLCPCPEHGDSSSNGEYTVVDTDVLSQKYKANFCPDEYIEEKETISSPIKNEQTVEGSSKNDKINSGDSSDLISNGYTDNQDAEKRAGYEYKSSDGFSLFGDSFDSFSVLRGNAGQVPMNTQDVSSADLGSSTTQENNIKNLHEPHYSPGLEMVKTFKTPDLSTKNTPSLDLHVGSSPVTGPPFKSPNPNDVSKLGWSLNPKLNTLTVRKNDQALETFGFSPKHDGTYGDYPSVSGQTLTDSAAESTTLTDASGSQPVEKLHPKTGIPEKPGLEMETGNFEPKANIRTFTDNKTNFHYVSQPLIPNSHSSISKTQQHQGLTMKPNDVPDVSSVPLSPATIPYGYATLANQGTPYISQKTGSGGIPYGDPTILLGEKTLKADSIRSKLYYSGDSLLPYDSKYPEIGQKGMVTGESTKTPNYSEDWHDQPSVDYTTGESESYRKILNTSGQSNIATVTKEVDLQTEYLPFDTPNSDYIGSLTPTKNLDEPCYSPSLEMVKTLNLSTNNKPSLDLHVGSSPVTGPPFKSPNPSDVSKLGWSLNPKLNTLTVRKNDQALETFGFSPKHDGTYGDYPSVSGQTLTDSAAESTTLTDASGSQPVEKLHPKTGIAEKLGLEMGTGNFEPKANIRTFTDNKTNFHYVSQPLIPNSHSSISKTQQHQGLTMKPNDVPDVSYVPLSPATIPYGYATLANQGTPYISHKTGSGGIPYGYPTILLGEKTLKADSIGSKLYYSGDSLLPYDSKYPEIGPKGMVTEESTKTPNYSEESILQTPASETTLLNRYATPSSQVGYKTDGLHQKSLSQPTDQLFAQFPTSGYQYDLSSNDHRASKNILNTPSPNMYNYGGNPQLFDGPQISSPYDKIIGKGDKITSVFKEGEVYKGNNDAGKKKTNEKIPKDNQTPGLFSSPDAKGKNANLKSENYGIQTAQSSSPKSSDNFNKELSRAQTDSIYEGTPEQPQIKKTPTATSENANEAVEKQESTSLKGVKPDLTSEDVNDKVVFVNEYAIKQSQLEDIINSFKIPEKCYFILPQVCSGPLHKYIHVIKSYPASVKADDCFVLLPSGLIVPLHFYKSIAASYAPDSLMLDTVSGVTVLPSGHFVKSSTIGNILASVKTPKEVIIVTHLDEAVPYDVYSKYMDKISDKDKKMLKVVIRNEKNPIPYEVYEEVLDEYVPKFPVDPESKKKILKLLGSNIKISLLKFLSILENYSKIKDATVTLPSQKSVSLKYFLQMAEILGKDYTKHCIVGIPNTENGISYPIMKEIFETYLGKKEINLTKDTDVNLKFPNDENPYSFGDKLRDGVNPVLEMEGANGYSPYGGYGEKGHGHSGYHFQPRPKHFLTKATEDVNLESSRPYNDLVNPRVESILDVLHPGHTELMRYHPHSDHFCGSHQRKSSRTRIFEY